MKRIFLSLSFALILVIGAQAQAILKFEKTSTDLGEFSEETPVSCVFTFTNTGDQPLVIHQAYSSCGCTVPTFTKDPIAPGETGEIKVTYNGAGKFPGKFKKPITIRSNASNNMVRIYIEGNMKVKEKK